MKIKHMLTVLAAAFVTSAVAQDPSYLVSLRVLNESGAPLPEAMVVVGSNRTTANEDGVVAFATRRNHPLTLQIEAAGYYPSVQTVTPGGDAVPDIRMVDRKAGRRLFVFAGDAMLSRRFMTPRAGERVLVRSDSVLDDGKKLLGFVKPYIDIADLASVNVETVLAHKSPDEALPKSVTFYSPPELAEVLAWAGFDYAALGNNHTFDYRDGGIRTTVKALQKAGLSFSGAGLNEDEARAPYEAVVDAKPVALLSYVGWPGTFNPTQSAIGAKGGAAHGTAESFEADVAAVADDSIVILQQHAGIEYAETPAITERSELRTAVDAGADIVIGHHPHVLQGIELHKNKLIAYSMGNFLFDQYIYSTQGGMLLYVWLDGEELHRAEVVPMNINGYVPTPATGAYRHWILNRIARLSSELGTCFTSSGQHAVTGPDVDCNTSNLSTEQLAHADVPQSLRAIGEYPVAPVQVTSADVQYRVGVDLLPRGDFEATGLFGTPPRAWLTGKQASLEKTADGQQLAVRVAKGKRVRTGMKVFDRAFQTSVPATASGRIYSDQPVKLRVYMQRRRIDKPFEDELNDGPLVRVGDLDVEPGEWQPFSLEHRMPRLSTKGVRLLLEVRAPGANKADANVLLDDLSWVEWRTPWLESGNSAEFGTHIQVRR